MVVNIVSLLEKLGFSTYEAKSYLALLKENPSSAYQIAKQAAIPSSKIYGVLEKLKREALVIEFQEKGKKSYQALSADQLIKNLRQNYNSILDKLAELLPKWEEKAALSAIWNLDQEKTVIEKLKQMITGSQKELLLSLWPQEYYKIHNELEEVQNRGNKIAMVHFGKLDSQIQQSFYHPLEDVLSAEKGGRFLLCLSDGQEALTAFFSRQNSEGAYSRNKGFVMMAEDYIKHDIYLTRLVRDFNPELIQYYGERYQRLRNIFSSEERG